MFSMASVMKEKSKDLFCYGFKIDHYLLTAWTWLINATPIQLTKKII